jgi:hypothetical protein
VVYFPHPNFKGKDMFAFALEGTSGLGAGTALVRVTAAVK